MRSPQAAYQTSGGALNADGWLTEPRLPSFTVVARRLNTLYKSPGEAVVLIERGEKTDSTTGRFRVVDWPGQVAGYLPTAFRAWMCWRSTPGCGEPGNQHQTLHASDMTALCAIIITILMSAKAPFLTSRKNTKISTHHLRASRGTSLLDVAR
ncbi:hypothetical protein VTO42DRAFT_175 [Malbranchea cinnamomea]